ncbi:hypothetical protein OYT88_02235 [Sporolactobacillus sp. CQH2019]|uniref:hypothetical protein n=1 Tax=Sporolactobacillus sp. CQH2019 TaxID=3023512 RepID=UPI002368C7DD|nr:hypothetical protein [Sporolactobacillus sp. CQH2019]MDD9147368.1 hypothetical protein [Sporolactobacillus sp. CQH2019]
MSVDSGAFFTDEEKKIFNEMTKANRMIDKINNKKDAFKNKTELFNNNTETFEKQKVNFQKIKKVNQRNIKKMNRINDDYDNLKKEYDVLKINYKRFKDMISKPLIYIDETAKEKWKLKNNKITIKKFLSKKSSEFDKQLKSKLDKFEGVRKIRKDNICYFNKTDGTKGHYHLRQSKVISMFDSILTRLIGCRGKEITKELIIIKNYYYPVMRNLIENGFCFGNIHYIYLSSSSGQIKDHKMVFIRERTYNKIQNTLMCGLTKKNINSYADKDGNQGVNPNKFNSYLSLVSSASVEWSDFPIDKILIVPDLKTQVTDKFDVLTRGKDDKYKITDRGEKVTVPVESFDGFGVIDKSLAKSPFIFRAPWCKGLLCPVPLKEFINDNKNDSELWIKDAWNKPHNVVEEHTRIIMTASQMKMNKYYTSQQDFIDKFKGNICKAAIVTKDDVRENVNLNYQFLQTLDLNDDEIADLTDECISEFKKLGTDKETMLKYMGADDKTPSKNYFSKALSMYNELLNDTYSRECIKDKKASMIKEFKSGRFPIEGYHNIFILPDVYNFLSRLIGEDEHLLDQNEVSCKLFEDNTELDILRSPHLYVEHAIQTNKINQSERMKDYFCTDGLYISNKSSITLLIMADFDGDHISVTMNKTLIQAAKRQRKNYEIYPLYYEMFSSEPKELTSTVIYENLVSAYTQNIGIISNNISKILNSGKPDMDAVRYLCCKNNFTIDYAKTLKQVEFTKDVNEKLTPYTSNKTKVPHFFKWAKDKKENQVADWSDSTVNRLGKLMDENKYNLNFKKVAGRFDYTMLRSKKINYGKIAKQIVARYNELAGKLKTLIPDDKDIDQKRNPQTYAYYYIRKELKKIKKDEQYITDVLVDYLYENENKYKTTLWRCYGRYIVKNLENNLKTYGHCEKCGAKFKRAKAKRFCDECKEANKKVSKRKSRQKKQLALEA